MPDMIPPRQRPVIPIYTSTSNRQVDGYHITMGKGLHWDGMWCYAWAPWSKHPIAGGDAFHCRKAIWKDMGYA